MRRALPLSTRTLLLSSLCTCAVLVAGFVALDAAIQTRIKEALEANLQETQQQLVEAHVEGDRQSAKLLAGLSDNAGLKAAIDLARSQPTPALEAEARNTVEDALRQVSSGLGYDLLMVLDTRGRVIAITGKSGARRGERFSVLGDPTGTSLVRVGNEMYRLTRVPINLGAENLGSLAAGKAFHLSAPEDFEYAVLLGPHGIESSTLPRALRASATTAQLERCGRLSSGCEIRLAGESLLVLKAAPFLARSDYTVLLLGSTERAMRTFTQGFWQAFLVTGCGGALIALFLSVFVSRSISKPLADLVADLEKCGKTGDLPETFHVNTPTREVNALAQALNRASAARHEFEFKLVEATKAAQAASEAKSEFLANVSHELRTPLNGILGLTSLVLDTELAAEQREYMSMVSVSGHGLLRIINDILDFSQIQTGKLSLARAEFSLESGLAGAIQPFSIQAQEKGLRLTYELNSDVPEALAGDVGRLRQILVHLVGNAIKFTERGAITLRVETEAAEGNSCVLHFTVADSGIGIPVEKQRAIFEAFAQADGSTTRKYGGAGLGLAIAAGLVEAMQGRIWVESEPGRGSVFHFTARFGVPEYVTSGKETCTYA